MNTIEFVYFDIGNVLLFFRGGLSKLAEKFGLNYSDFERVFCKYDDAVCRGGLSPQQLWTTYQAELHFTSDADFDFARYWVANFTIIQDTFALVREIADAGIPVGLLSNIYAGVFEIINEAQLFPFTNWAQTILSCDVGFVKPEPEIYELAEQKSGTSSELILFIDDKSDFLEPARKRGWQTYLFDPSNPITSTNTIRSIFQLPHLAQ